VWEELNKLGGKRLVMFSTIKKRIPKKIKVKVKDKIKDNTPDIIKNTYKFYRKRQIKNKRPLITQEKIIADLLQVGIKKGDSILLHSSLKSIGYVEKGPQTVINAILDVITTKGTLAVPAYNQIRGGMYKTCVEYNTPFDPRTSTTYLGAIPETFLGFPGITRSVHPTHSIAAIGKYADFITEAHHYAKLTFGKDSPWDRLMRIDGKLLMIGITLGPNTFSHTIEDILLDEYPLPVRMEEVFRLKCKDWDGNIVEVSVNPLDPEYVKLRYDRSGRRETMAFFWNEYKKAGVLTVGNIGEAKSWVASMNDYYNYLVYLMNKEITIYSDFEDIENFNRER
jgi:aminoglycoside 3-N-acetyltransferase